MKVRPYTDADAEPWDELVGRSACGTFLHTRRFQCYHGGRFEDVSVLCEDGKGRIIGVFPAARKPDDRSCVVSHPGATYGGLIHEQDLGAGDVEEMIGDIVLHYRSQGFGRLDYKSVPPLFHSVFCQSDLQAIWKLGGVVARRDLWNVVTLGCRPRYSSHHVRAIGRARKCGVAVEIADTAKSYRGFHGILEERLADRYGVAPVHSLEEMLMLRERFPESIALWLARDSAGQVVAGTWLFMIGKRVWHTQYIASTAQGRDLCATHLLFDGIIRQAERRGVGFVSFGCSSEDDGRRLNRGLFAFKSGFVAGAVCHDTYHITVT